MKNTITPKTFSIELEEWLKSDKPKTLGGLRDVFAEKSFVVIFILFMALPALPLPTGGVTHVFEIIVIIMSFQLILGFQKFWLPKKLRSSKLKSLTNHKTVRRLVKFIDWFERHSKPRMADLIQKKGFVSFYAFVVLLFTTFAFISPPFSGLDTLPAMGVVVISLGLLLEDMLIIGFGAIVGSLGIGLIVFLSDAIIRTFQNFFF